MTVWRHVRDFGIALGTALLLAGLPLALGPWTLVGLGLFVLGAVLAIGLALFTPSGRHECDPLSPIRRLSVAGIWLHSRTRKAIRAMLRPGAWLTTVAVAVYGVLQLSKALDKPSIWSAGSNWNWVLFGTGVAAIVGSMLVSLGYPRLLKRVRRHAKLLGVCQDAAGIAADDLGISHHDLAVHVWQLRGCRGARYLDQAAAYRPHGRPRTWVTWRKGKGALGACWAQNLAFVADVEDLDRQIEEATEEDDKEAFCSLDSSVRFELSWTEFQRVRHYRSVLVVPLQGGVPGRYSLRGIFALGLLVDGKADDLERLGKTRELANVFAVCEAALAGTPTTGSA